MNLAETNIALNEFLKIEAVDKLTYGDYILRSNSLSGCSTGTEYKILEFVPRLSGSVTLYFNDNNYDATSHVKYVYKDGTLLHTYTDSDTTDMRELDVILGHKYTVTIKTVGGDDGYSANGKLSGKLGFNKIVI